MKKRFNKYFPSMFISGELVVLIIVYCLSLLIIYGEIALNNSGLITFFVYIVLWPLITIVNKDFKVGRAVSYYQTFKRAFTTTFLFVSLLSITWILLDIQSVNRSFLVTLFVLLFLWMTIYRVFVHLALDRYRAFGGNIRYAAILGYDKLGFKLFDVLKKKAHYGIRCKGFYTENSEKRNVSYPLQGSISDFLESDLSQIDVIYVSEKVSKGLLKQTVDIADDLLIKVKLLPEFNKELVKSFSLRRFDDVPVVDVNDLPLDTFWNRLVKRTFDILFSLTVLIGVMSWLFPIIALLIKRSSKGPVLFKQSRNGVNNEPFYCYKFRTMELNNEADLKWAEKNDPRITKVGRFLRATSLDEFPQFMNVLLGQMSIVGPRPHPINLNDTYRDQVQKYSKRHASKPGVTGLAQAMGYRGEIQEFYQMSSRVRLDRFYLQNWTFWLDLKIIFLTIFSILQGQDKAY